MRPENRATLNIRWLFAPDRVRAARAPAFLDIGNDELLFAGGWRPESSPLAGYGWRVPKDWVVANVLRGGAIPARLAEDPAEVRNMIMAHQAAESPKRQAE